VQFGTLRVNVIHEEFSALNFTSVNVAKLSSQTLRKSSSFRSLRRLHELAKLSTLTTLHSAKFIHDFATTLVMHQACLMLPLSLQSFNGVNRVWPFGELRIPLLRAFPAPNPLPYSKYGTQTTQILLARGVHLYFLCFCSSYCSYRYYRQRRARRHATINVVDFSDVTRCQNCQWRDNVSEQARKGFLCLWCDGRTDGRTDIFQCKYSDAREDIRGAVPLY